MHAAVCCEKRRRRNLCCLPDARRWRAAVLQEASGAADAARQEALELRSQLTAAQATIRALQVCM